MRFICAYMTESKVSAASKSGWHPQPLTALEEHSGFPKKLDDGAEKRKMA
jgi:hypothetical protein